MNFVNIAFPDCITFGAQSEPEWSTALTAVLGGQEFTNENWEDAKHHFDVPFAPRKASEYLLIRKHFHEVRGRANAFPVKDFLDYQVAVSEGVLLSD